MRVIKGKAGFAVFSGKALALAALVAATMLFAAAFMPARAHADSSVTIAPMNAQADTISVNLDVKYGQTEARSMCKMINDFRQSSDAWAWNQDNQSITTYSNLAKLTYDYKLESIAMYRAAELSLYYSHELPDTSDTKARVWSRYSDYKSAAENIAIGYGSASEVFEAWREDNYGYSGQGHRRNMLDSKLTAVGIGHAEVNGVHCWVQVFAGRTYQTSSTTANNSLKTVSVKLVNSFVTSRSITASPTEIVLHPGESMVLPSVTGWIRTTKSWSYEDDFVPVRVSPTWSSADSSIAGISSGKVVAGAFGSTTLTARATIGSSVSTTASVSVEPWRLYDATIQALPSFTYDGTAKRPAPVVTYGSKTLIAGTDYTVSYSDNVKPGIATVTVTGKGDYAGSIGSYFRISRIDISGAAVSAASGTYTGQAIEPVPIVKLGTKTLSAGTDYTVSYSNNIKAGTATVTVTGEGNYEGTASAAFKISCADVVRASISVANKKYTGKAIKPKPTVSLGSVTLVRGTDYTVSYKNNVKPGKATLTVKGKGNFAGSKSVRFTIKKVVKIKASKVKVAKIKNQEYTGYKVTPTIVAKYKGKKLVKGRDFKVKYSNNKKMGKAKATITFKGNYKGKIVRSFKIVAPKVGKPKITSTTSQSGYARIDWDSGSNSDGTQLQIIMGSSVLYDQHIAGSWGYGHCNRSGSFTSADFWIRSYKTVAGRTYYSGWVSRSL